MSAIFRNALLVTLVASCASRDVDLAPDMPASQVASLTTGGVTVTSPTRKLELWIVDVGGREVGEAERVRIAGGEHCIRLHAVVRETQTPMNTVVSEASSDPLCFRAMAGRSYTARYQELFRDDHFWIESNGRIVAGAPPPAYGR